MRALIKRHGTKLVQGGMGATILALLVDAWIQHGSSFELQTKNDLLKISGEKYYAQVKSQEQEITALKIEVAYLDGWLHLQKERTNNNE